jgi:small-conductance mechanosensitive channel
MRGLVTALIATAVLTIFLVFFIWLTRRIADVLSRRLKPKVIAIRVQSIQLIPGEQVWGTLALLARGTKLLAILLAVYLYAEIVLRQFPQTRAIGERLSAYLIDPLTTMGRGFVDELPSLMFLLVLFFVVRFLLRMLRLYFAAIGSGTVKVANFEPAWSVPTYRLVRLGVIAFALVVAYPYVPGSSSDAFKGLSIFFGVLLSIGSSSFVSNNIAGYALIYRRLFAVGDRVRIGDIVGEVLDMRLQVTRLRTFKNEEVIVPNSTILNSVVLNYSSLAVSRGLILHTTVGIGYETPWRQVEGMLLMAAARTPAVESEPRPFVLQKALGDFCVTYELNVYTSSADGMAELYHALHANILDVFNEYGVQIMTPAYEGDPPEPKVVPKDRWYQEPSLAAESETRPARR